VLVSLVVLGGATLCPVAGRQLVESVVETSSQTPVLARIARVCVGPQGSSKCLQFALTWCPVRLSSLTHSFKIHCCLFQFMIVESRGGPTWQVRPQIEKR
jgi:hypothetical protein